ncbi:MAG: peptidylprolyl isomerase [Planctomycetota bacterium]
MIQEGSKVSLEYTLKLDDGTTADTNVGGEPLKYQHGAGEILPALEEKLAGLGTDETKTVTLPPEHGYGPVDPSAFQEVAPDVIPEEARQVDARLVAQDASGAQRPVRVDQVHDDKIVLDLNHPLAGRTLHFEVKILAVE